MHASLNRLNVLSTTKLGYSTPGTFIIKYNVATSGNSEPIEHPFPSGTQIQVLGVYRSEE
jgi:hypothetical protein